MANLKNLPEDIPQKLADMITPRQNQIVSMALSKSDNVSVSLFTFANEETVSEEEYFGDTMYYIVEGETYITKGINKTILKTGEIIKVPAHTLHAIGGIGEFKVLQITINE